ncbi:MAG: arginyltransferase [Magnetococcales bacterium]|nr:arginyltransferase [Magnetococcales bacterium]
MTQLPPPTDHIELELFQTKPHECGYLADRDAATLFVNPDTQMDMSRFEFLLAIGYRRSGNIVYRPRCDGCNACIPVRVPVEGFRASRSLRRIRDRNQDLTIHPEEPVFNEERFDLYLRYLAGRHAQGPMTNSSPEDFQDFLLSDWCRTSFVDFRLQGRLVMTAVIDRLEHSLSAVYTFFDPQERERGLGTFAVLWEIAEARALGMHWLYLGYWIAESHKMSYKARFQPLEAYRQRQWLPWTAR